MRGSERREREQEAVAGVNIEAGPRSFPLGILGKGTFPLCLAVLIKGLNHSESYKKGAWGGNKNLLEPTWQKSSFQGHIAQCLYRSGLNSL